MIQTLTAAARTALLAIGTVVAAATPTETRPASAEAAPAPDIRVAYVAKATGDARTTYYTFLVTNVGDATADSVRLTHTTTQAEPTRRASAREQSTGGSTVVSVVPRESMTVTVVCDPEPGNICTGADVRAATPDDRDTRDNWDRSR